MANQPISGLTEANAVQASDLFVLEQTGVAKKLPGQKLENWLLAMAQGHGGIQSIAKTSTAGLVDTYTITYADTSTSNFTVTNGAQGATGAQTYVWIKWASQNPTSDDQMSDLPDAYIGLYVGLASTAPATYTSYTWYNWKGEKGDTGDGITGVARTSGTGEQGTTDVYTMYAGTPGEAIGTFNVYQGADGTGAPGTQTPLADVSGGSVGESVLFARQDHQHPFPQNLSGIYFKSVTVSGNSRVLVEMSGTTRGAILFSGYTDKRMGIGYFTTNSSGVLHTALQLVESGQITLTSGTNAGEMYINNSVNQAFSALIITFVGNEPTVNDPTPMP